MVYQDLPLGHAPATPPQPPRSSSTVRWVLALAAVAAVAGALYFWWLTRMPAQPAAPVPAPPTDAAVGTARPARQPLELPALDGSDTFVRDLVATLSTHPLIARLVTPSGVVRTAVLAVAQIADGRTPHVPLKPLKPATRLTLAWPAGADSGHIAPASFARWDGAVAALTSVRSRDAAQLYVNLKPLFDAAYADLGHPDGDFDDSLTQAIRMLLETPDVPDDGLVLLRRPAYMEHTDPALRTLRPVQKQFLLVGELHRASLRAWWSNFAKTLDLQLPIR